MKQFSFLFFILSLSLANAQYKFSGHLGEEEKGKVVYLSIIEDYRKTSRVYLDQIISKTSTDSLGYFTFRGDNLSADNNIYRIHTDECSELGQLNTHFLNSCGATKSVLFLAKNADTLSFAKTLNNEPFCTVLSTNSKSGVLLEIEDLRNEMIFDFSEIRSDASKKLNLKKWFARWQQYGKAQNEPLAELYIYGFLSNRQNETYQYYLDDLATNPYYEDLLERLEAKYSSSVYTSLYREELRANRYLINSDLDFIAKYLWWIALLLGGSLFLNLYFFLKWKSRKKSIRSQLEQLSAQERRIAEAMAKGKTNKEIAQDFFISLSTVKTHVNNIYKKLEVRSREEIKSNYYK
jgi:DNA-binding CsgD family transcriptional regulator